LLAKHLRLDAARGHDDYLDAKQPEFTAQTAGKPLDSMFARRIGGYERTGDLSFDGTNIDNASGLSADRIRPQQGQQGDGDGHHAEYIDVEYGTDVFHFLEFDRTRRGQHARVVDQAVQHAIAGDSPDSTRQFSNVLLYGNIA